MKYIFSILIVLFSFGGFAQDSTKTHKIGLIVKADVFLPIAYLIDDVRKFSDGYYVSVSTEKTIKKRQSFQLTGTYKWNPHYFEERRIFEIIPEYKFFILRYKTCNGPFLGVYGKYYRGEVIYNNEMNPKYNSISYARCIAGGFSTGYQYYILNNRIEMDFLFGWGRFYEIANNSINLAHYWDDDFRVSFNIGYRF